MNERSKQRLFLVLTLPGVAFPFMNFALGESPYELLTEVLTWGLPDFIGPIYVSMMLSISVVFAPFALLLVDSWRLRRPVPPLVIALVRVYGLVTGVSFLGFLIGAMAAGDFVWMWNNGWSIAFYGIGLTLSATTVVFITSRWRNKSPVDRSPEIGLMGAFISIVATYAVVFEFELKAGGYIGLYICLVFLIRIIDRLWHPVSAQPG